MPIFDITLDNLRSSPGDRRIALIMRHSVRYPIVDEASIFTAGLTPEGVLLAEQLGVELAGVRQVRRIVTNYIGRCVDTAAAIARGVGHDDGVLKDQRLSHPFIEPAWSALPIAWPNDPPPQQLMDVLEMVLSTPNEAGTVDVYVTHDTIVGVVAGYLMDEVFVFPENWPQYLEGIALWQEQDELCVLWRGKFKRFKGLLQPVG